MTTGQKIIATGIEFETGTVYMEIFTMRKFSPILPPSLIGENFIMISFCPVLNIA